MRPKTFPAAPYVGNTRQRLQEIKEGLKQPAKLVSQALHGGGSRADGGRAADCKSGKDTASRQQQLRPPQKFNNYQNALREIRKSLMPFANESGPSSGSGPPPGAGEVNRQMLQELVNAGCDQVGVLLFVWNLEAAAAALQGAFFEGLASFQNGVACPLRNAPFFTCLFFCLFTRRHAFGSFRPAFGDRKVSRGLVVRLLFSMLFGLVPGVNCLPVRNV